MKLKMIRIRNSLTFTILVAHGDTSGSVGLNTIMALMLMQMQPPKGM